MTAEGDLKAAVDYLCSRDPDIARAVEHCGVPAPRSRPPGFDGLLQIIVAQQLSAASAGAIIGRLLALADPLTPETFLALDDARLRAIGLSGGKRRYGRILAEAVLSGDLDLAAIAGLDDAAAIKALTRVTGIGRWTAEIYLLFALGRPDIWPADDLAVRVAVQRLKGLDAPPKRPEMEAIATPWRPRRSAAACLLWHLYRHPGLPEVNRA